MCFIGRGARSQSSSAGCLGVVWAGCGGRGREDNGILVCLTVFAGGAPGLGGLVGSAHTVIKSSEVLPYVGSKPCSLAWPAVGVSEGWWFLLPYLCFLRGSHIFMQCGV